MAEPKFTDDGWVVRGNIVEVYGRGTVAICPPPTISDGGVMEFIANAALIAAAPDLYAACKAALLPLVHAKHNTNSTVYDDDIAIIRAALARAEGGAE